MADELACKIKKLFNTLQVCCLIITARTFGRYQHSGWDEYGDFAHYEWRGHSVRIPMLYNTNGEEG